MIERHLTLDTRDGTMNTFVTHPEEGGPFPVVLFYMDAPGIREELHDMARRIATAGYYLVVPNLYYRTVASFDYAAEGRDRMFELMQTLTDALVMSDTMAMISMVDGDPAADARHIGCVGYCMSGPFVFAAASSFADRIACAASIYGVRLFGENSPAAGAVHVQGELYFACAEHDDYVPAGMVDDLEAHLHSLGACARVERYPGTHHGFAFPSRTGIYDKPSAERHWERLHALFDRNLRR